MKPTVLSFLGVVIAAAMGTLTAGGCKDAKQAPSASAVGAILDLATADASRCLPCHQTIVDEWTQAMHAQSTVERDPLYAMMVSKATAVLGEEVPAKCGRCHAPSGLGSSARERDGVTCLACHELAQDHPGQPGPARTEPTYARPTPQTKDSSALCLGCHGEFKSPAGHEVCTTGAEHAAAAAAGIEQRCVDCHMPVAPGPAVFRSGAKEHRSHRFPAARAGLLAAGAATVEAARDAATGELVVTVKTANIGHALPTGNPMRFVVATVSAEDGAGTALWKNHGEALPPFDAGEALFMRIFSDADGKRPVPPFMAAGAAVDQRLQPGTPRTLRYTVPKETARVRVDLTYYLGPPKTLTAAKVDPMWHQPIPLAQAVLEWKAAQ